MGMGMGMGMLRKTKKVRACVRRDLCCFHFHDHDHPSIKQAIIPDQSNPDPPLPFPFRTVEEGSSKADVEG